MYNVANDEIDADKLIAETKERIAKLRASKPVSQEAKNLLTQISTPEHFEAMMEAKELKRG